MIHLFHFNDIYNLEERKQEPVGGASRFSSLVKGLRETHEDIKLVFGGDAMSPSLISTVTRGKHVPPVFNEVKVDYACCGNHDFDFGCERLSQLMKLCNFPWLLANIVYDADGEEKPLSGATPYLMEEINGVKVGIMGLAEEEWIACLTKLPDTTKYLDQAEVGREICKKLRAEGCKIVVALTHSREPQDTYLANNCPDIDLILGGHDHDYYIRHVNNIPIVHSGSEFRHGTLVQVSLNDPENPDSSEPSSIDDNATDWKFVGPRVTCTLKKYDVTQEIAKDPAMDVILESCNDLVKKKMGKVLGETATDWDVTFQKCRLQENNVGDFLTDLMREGYKADMALLCGGTLRSNNVYPKGEIKMGDIMKILPFPDTVSVAKIKGKYLIEALENGFSAYPAAEGRFPQVSGIKVEFDPNRPPHKRITKFLICDAPIEEERVYTLATKPFLLSGGDGYSALGNYEELIVDDEGLPLSTLIRNYFIEIKVINALSRAKRVDDIVATAFTPTMHERKLRASPKTDGRIVIPRVE